MKNLRLGLGHCLASLVHLTACHWRHQST
uniref:Uncharacterized protein n=1 Tax=Arundo donax TaxID=35708 RepID=A0A0A9A2K4_ARUDO